MLRRERTGEVGEEIQNKKKKTEGAFTNHDLI